MSESSAKPSMSRDYLIRLRDMLAAATRARAYATGVPDAATLAANQRSGINNAPTDPSEAAPRAERPQPLPFQEQGRDGGVGKLVGGAR